MIDGFNPSAFVLQPAGTFGNVGTTVTFRVGPFDAEVLETIFAPKFTAEDLVNLGFTQIYLTLMIDGVGSPPFYAVTIPPIQPPKQTFERDVVARSRAAYARPRAEIETAIFADLASTVNALVGGEAERQAEKQAKLDRKRAAARDAREKERTEHRRNTQERQERPRPREEQSRQNVPQRQELLPDGPGVPLKNNRELRDILKRLSNEQGSAQKKEPVRKENPPLREALKAVLPSQAKQQTRAEASPEGKEGAPPHHVPEDVLKNMIHGA